MASSRNEHLRFRYGVCLNDGCSKCKAKEVQQIPARKELVCTECGKPLRECRRPLTWWEKNGKKVIGASAAAVVVGAGTAFGLGAFDGPEAPKPVTEHVRPIKKKGGKSKVADKDSVVDTVAAPATAEPVVEPAEVVEAKVSDSKPVVEPAGGSVTGMGTINFDYGKYVGEIRNGKPDGSGVLTYSKAQKVVSTKDVMAQPGERIEGVFENGKATFVTLYKKDGNTIKIKR